MKPLKFFCATVLLGLFFSDARANTILIDEGPGSASITPRDATFGYDFTVGSNPILITDLGIWDEGADGLTNSHMVGLWDTSGNLLGSVLISSGTGASLIGEFRYATLTTPVVLTAGMTYILGAGYMANDADRFITNEAGDQASFDPAVTGGNLRSALFTQFGFPGFNEGPGSYVGPNAQFTTEIPTNGRAVPDGGSTLMLLLFGFTGAFGFRSALARQFQYGRQ